MGRLLNWFRDMKVAKTINFIFVILIAAVSIIEACLIKQLKRILNHKLRVVLTTI